MENNKPTYSKIKGSQGWLWSDEEIEILKEKGQEIAEKLNRSLSSIS